MNFVAKVPRELALAGFTETVFTLTAYALPLIVLPSLIADAVEFPKLAVLSLSTAALIGIGLARFFIYRQAILPANRIFLPLLLFLTWASLSVAASPTPLVAGRALLYVCALATASLMIALLPEPHRFINALLVSSALVALYGLSQFMNFDPFPWASHFRPRIFSSMGNPVFLGGFLAAIFPLAFARWLYVKREETKDLLTLLLVILGIAIYLTWTRSAWLGVLLSTAMQIGLLAARSTGRRLLAENRAWLFTAGLVGAVAVTLVSSTRIMNSEPVPLLDRLRDAVNLQGYSVRFRLVTAESALRIAATHPLTGSGLASFQSTYPHVRLHTRAAKSAANQFFASQEAYAHNDHLQILAELGVVGFGLWIWLLICAMRAALWREQAGNWLGLGILGTLTAVCVDGCLNFPLHIVVTAWVFFCTLGLLSQPARVPEPTRGGKWRAAAAGLLVAACLLLILHPIRDTLRAQYYLMLGDRQVNSNNYEMASSYYTQALTGGANNKFINFRASVALMHTSRFEWYGITLDESLRLAKNALALGYEDENVYKHLGDIYGRKTDVRKAIAVLSRSNRLHPKREDVANNLAYYLAESGTRLAEAVRLAEQAVRQTDGDPTFLDTLGWAQYRNGQLVEAEKSFVLALKRLAASSADPAQQLARSEIEDHLAKVRRARRR